jgi:hypothetical protein
MQVDRQRYHSSGSLNCTNTAVQMGVSSAIQNAAQQQRADQLDTKQQHEQQEEQERKCSSEQKDAAPAAATYENWSADGASSESIAQALEDAGNLSAEQAAENSRWNGCD